MIQRKRYANRGQMRAAGYEFRSAATPCKYCSTPLTWAKTPNGKNICLEGDGETDVTVHFGRCSSASERTEPPAAKPPAPLSRP